MSDEFNLELELENVDMYFNKEKHINVMEIEKASPLDVNELPAAILRMSTGQTDFKSVYRKADLLRRTANRHTWTRASVMAIGRAAIGSGFDFVKHPIFGKALKRSDVSKTDKTLAEVYAFFYGADTDWQYIQDVQTPSSKMMYTVGSFILYGQSAWEIVRDKSGKPVRYDALPGIVYPNVDEKGRFQSPAYFYRAWNSETVVKYKSPLDIIYFCWPGLDYSIFGNTEFDALATTTIPSDMYASVAYKSHFENMNTPYNGVWVISPTTSDEDVNKFLQLLLRRYTGPANFGRNPLAIRGDVEFKETTSLSEEDAPYLEGRKYNQAEISAVTGVSSAKLGLADNASKTNYRELKRDFYENTLRPVFAILEETIYEQLMWREFNIKEFKLAFNAPDFTTALEKGTILTRYVATGVYSPNEARAELGKELRSDKFGDEFVIPAGTPGAEVDTEENLKPVPKEKETNSDQQEGTSRRSKDTKRPPTEPRTSPKNESEKSSMQDIISELQTWRKFASRVAKGDRKERPFVATHIDITSCLQIEEMIKNLNIEETKTFFDNLIDEIQSE